MAAWDTGDDPTELTHHSDHESNNIAMVHTDQIVELGGVPLTGTVGNLSDNAMAEAVHDLYKTGPIRQRGLRRVVKQVELAGLEWVWWWNNERIHGITSWPLRPLALTSVLRGGRMPFFATQESTRRQGGRDGWQFER